MNTRKLLKKIKELEPRPLVIESYWSQDRRGWGVVISAITKGSSAMHPEYTEVMLEFLQGFGGDMRISMREVPPWPEVEDARDFGTIAEEELGIPYFHNVADEPDDLEPRWWDKQKA